MAKAKAKVSKLSVEGRAESNYEFYRIVAGQMNGACQAIGYHGRHRIAAAAGKSVEEAVAEVKGELGKRSAALRQTRNNGMPTAAEYREALVAASVALPDGATTVLRIHSQQPGATATFAELARRSGEDEAGIARAYGRMGRSLEGMLNLSFESDGFDRQLATMQSFAVIEPSQHRSKAALRLRTQVVEALNSLE